MVTHLLLQSYCVSVRKLLMMSWLHNIWQNQATCIVCPIIGHRQGMLKCIFHVWKSKLRDKYRCCHASGSQTGDRRRNWRNTKRSPSRSCQNAARSAQHIERIASDIVIIPVCKICCPQPGRISRWSFNYHVNIIKYQYPYQCIDCTYIYNSNDQLSELDPMRSTLQIVVTCGGRLEVNTSMMHRRGAHNTVPCKDDLWTLDVSC